MHTARRTEQTSEGKHARATHHSQDAERHEQSAKHHAMALKREERDDRRGGADRARRTRGHAIHVAMRWIDPASLPETDGALTRFLYDVHGDVDGFLLDGDRQVHFPAHLSDALLQVVKVGDRIKVRGLKPRDVDLLIAASVTASGGTVILDEDQDF